MKRAFLAVVLFSALLVACRDRENSITGMSGSNSIAGQVVLTGDLAGASAAGIEVRVRGTGPGTVTDGEGRFMIVGVPSSDIELAFSRWDGIAATFAIADVASASNLQLDLTRSSAHGRRRGLDRSRDEIEGVITAASATSITVHDSHGEDVVVKLDDKTVIRKGEQPVAAADLKVGMRVHVKVTRGEDGSFTALEVIVQNDDSASLEIEGVITAASATSITVHDSHGEDVVVKLDDKTVIRKGEQPVAAADLKVGMRVHVKVTRGEDGSLTAVEVIVQDESPGGEADSRVEVSGIAKTVAADNLVVTTDKGDITVRVDSNTTIRKRSAVVTLSQISAGDHVEAVGTRIDATTILAERISVR